MELDELLQAIDRAAANLEKLERVWERAEPFIPTSPQRGAPLEYDRLRRQWSELLPGLPEIDGWTITEELPDFVEFLTECQGAESHYGRGRALLSESGDIPPDQRLMETILASQVRPISASLFLRSISRRWVSIHEPTSEGVAAIFRGRRR